MFALHAEHWNAQADRRQRLLAKNEVAYAADSYLMLLQMPVTKHRPSQIGAKRVNFNQTAPSNPKDIGLTKNASTGLTKNASAGLTKNASAGLTNNALADSISTRKGIVSTPTVSHKLMLGLAALVRFNSSRKEIVSSGFSEVTGSTGAAVVVLLCVLIIVAALAGWYAIGDDPMPFRRSNRARPHEQRFLNEARGARTDPRWGDVLAKKAPTTENRPLPHSRDRPPSTLPPSTLPTSTLPQSKDRCPSTGSSRYPVSPFNSPGTSRARAWKPLIASNMPLSSSSQPPSPFASAQLPHRLMGSQRLLFPTNAVLCPSLVLGHTETWFSIVIQDMMSGSGSFNIMGISGNAVLCGQWASTSSARQIAISISSHFPVLATATEVVDSSQAEDRPLFEIRNSDDQLFGTMRRQSGGQLVLQKDDKRVLCIDVDARTDDLNVIGEQGPVAVVSRNAGAGCERLEVQIGARVDCIMILTCVIGMACLSSPYCDA